MTDPGLRLFIKHLPLTWTERTIEEYFQAYGEVLSVFLFKANQQSKLKHRSWECIYKLQDKV